MKTFKKLALVATTTAVLALAAGAATAVTVGCIGQYDPATGVCTPSPNPVPPGTLCRLVPWLCR